MNGCVDDEGDELSGKVNSDIKISKFASASGDVSNVRLRVFLNLKEKPDNKESFFTLLEDENIAELDKSVGNKFHIDKVNTSTNMSGFLMCCERGKVESLKWLLQKKSNVNQRTQDGSNGLHLAIRSGQKETVDHLVAMGISVFDADGDDLTPFLLACSVCNIHAAKLMLRRGAKVNDCQSSTGRNGVHLAVKHGHITMLQFLIEEKKVSLECADKNGMTPFLLACEYGRLDLVKWLVEQGCNTSVASSSGGDEGGSTALHIVSKYGFIDLAVYLLDLGLPTSLRDNKGFTVVAKAKACGHSEIADLILDREILNAGTLDVELFFRLLEAKESDRARHYLESFMKDVGSQRMIRTYCCT